MRSRAGVLALAVCVITGVVSDNVAWAQSGRGRPRVPTREPEKPPPDPVRVPENSAIAAKEQSGNRSRFVLKNRMTVILDEQHSTPLVTAVAHFGVGYVNEPRPFGGLSHLAEHLLLRTGTPSLAERVRAIGGWMTSYSQPGGTSYLIVAPPDKTKEILALQSELLRASFGEQELRREIDTLVEELRWTEGALPLHDPDVIAGDRAALARLHVQKAAFSVDVAPGEQFLRSVTPEQLTEFCATHYKPENLVLSLVGAISTFETLVEIQKLYGRLPKPANPKDPAVATVQSQAGKLRYASTRTDLARPIVSVGFEAPGSGAKEAAEIEVLASLAANGRASRLSQALVDQGLASRVEVSCPRFGEKRLLTFQIWPEPEAMDKAEAMLFKELDRIRRDPPSAAELARAKAMAEKRFLDRTSSDAARALWLADTASIKLADFLAQITRVSEERIQQLAATYLILGNATVHEYQPLSSAPRSFDSVSYAVTVVTWAPGMNQPVPVKAGPSAPTAAEPAQERNALESLQPVPVRDFSTLNGPKAFVREDHSRPLVAMALLFQGGRISEDEPSNGLTELMLRTMLYGSPRLTAPQVAAELDRLGAEIEPVTELDFFGFLLTAPSRNAENAIRILRDLVEEPAFRDDDFQRAVTQHKAAIREDRDNFLKRSRQLLFQTLFPGHPYSLPALGREEIISKVNAEQVRQWHESTVKRQLPTIVIVGDTDGSALVSGEIAERFRRRETDRSLPVKAPRQLDARDRAETVENGYRPVTTAAIGFVGPKGESSDPAAIELVKAALSGPGVPIWTVESEAAFVAGAFYVVGITSPRDESRVREAVSREIDRLASNGLSEVELLIARTRAATARLSALQSQSFHALEYARTVFNQRQAGEADGFTDLVAKRTSDDVKRLAAGLKQSGIRAGVIRGVQSDRKIK